MIYETEQEKDKKNKPSYTNKRYDALCPLWEIVCDVQKGETALKAKSKQYLYKFPIESVDSYHDRAQIATLYPAYANTLEGMTGLVFNKQIVLHKREEGDYIDNNDAVPEQIAEHWENIDNASTHGNMFCQRVFTNYIRDGYTFIVVDKPAIQIENALQESLIRPYWVSYEACQALNWQHQNINGQNVLARITFKECTFEEDGEFGEKEVVRYRRWRLLPVEGEYRACWTLYVEEKNEQTQKIEIVLEQGPDIITDLDRIPVVVVGHIGDVPPLLDLARLNIRHRQQDSNYQKGLAYAGLVVPFAVNRSTQASEQPIGWDILIDCDKDGTFGFAETSGQAIEAHERGLEKLEKQMAELGLSFLLEKAPAKTATEVVTQNAQKNSKLSNWAFEIQDAIEEALQLHATYLNLASGGSIELGTALRELILSPEEIRVWLDMFDKKAITLERLWMMLQKGGKLPDDFDSKAEKDKLDAESQASKNAR